MQKVIFNEQKIYRTYEVTIKYNVYVKDINIMILPPSIVPNSVQL